MKVLIVAMIGSLVAIIQMATPDLHANGNAIEIFSGTENGYDITVGVQPKDIVVGTVHFTIKLFEVDTPVVVQHAKILIVAHDPNGTPAYQVKAVSLPRSPEYYDANITFEYPGTWKLMVLIEHGALGMATFSVPINVSDQTINGNFAGTIVWLGVLITLLGGTLFVWYRSRQQAIP